MMLKPTLAFALCIIWGIVAWRLFGPEHSSAPTLNFPPAQKAQTKSRKYEITGLSENLFGTTSTPIKPKATSARKGPSPKKIKSKPKPKQHAPFPKTQYLGYVKSEDEPATAHIRLENKVYKVQAGDSLGPLLVKKINEASCQLKYVSGDSTLLRFRKTSPSQKAAASKLAARNR